MPKLENHQMATKEQLEIYLRSTKEQIAHAIAPLFIMIKKLIRKVEEQKEQIDHKDEIIIQKDVI